MHKSAKRGGFTLTELLVVVAIVAVIAAIVLPTVFAARARGQASACVSNMRQMSAGLLMYVQENDGVFPPIATDGENDGSNWSNALLGSVGDKRVFRCPSCPVPQVYDDVVPGQAPTVAVGYAFNSQLSQVMTTSGTQLGITNALPHPATTVTICESSVYSGPPGSVSQTTAEDAPDRGITDTPGATLLGEPGGLRHHGGSNYDFADGHTQWYRPEQVMPAGQTTAAGTVKTNDGVQPSFAL